MIIAIGQQISTNSIRHFLENHLDYIRALVPDGHVKEVVTLLVFGVA